MAAHRKPRQRPAAGTRTRTAATIALAGAAGATGLSGTGHAQPEPSPGQVRAEVHRLYREAEAATEKYNGAREEVRAAQARLRSMRDEAARREARLATEREALGSYAAAQYRVGGLDPVVRLALSEDPAGYLTGAALAERAGDRRAGAVSRVRRQIRELEQLRGAARVELDSLTSRQSELRRHKETITGKLAAAKRLLSRLTEEERARLSAPQGSRASSTAPGTASAPPPAVSVAPGSRAGAAIAYALQKLGSPYVWGATGPNAFDCSGLVQAAYAAAGVSLPRTTYAQIGTGRRVSRAELAPGDLVFFYSGITHVGLYIGNGRMIHAPNPSSTVRVAPLDSMPFAGATRVV